MIAPTGGSALIPKYKGYVVHARFGANNSAASTTTVFIVRDATGNGDIGANASGAAFPLLTTGTAFLYLSVTNTSSSTIAFNQTPELVITNTGHTGFPGTSCSIYALEPSGWTAIGVTATPKSVGKRGMSRLTFPATTLATGVPFAPGASYFGFSC